MVYMVCADQYLWTHFSAMTAEGPELVLACQRLAGHDGRHANGCSGSSVTTWLAEPPNGKGGD